MNRQLFIVLVALKNLTQRVASFSNPLRIPRAFLWGFPPQPLTASEIFYVPWLTCIFREKEEWEWKRKSVRKRQRDGEREKVKHGKCAVYLKEIWLSFSCLGGARLLAHSRWISKVAARVCSNIVLCSRIAPRLAYVGTSSSIVLEHSNSLLS